MFKFFKKNKKVKKNYSIVFCNTNNVNTVFGIYGTYETYEKADHIIRMGWNKKANQKIKDGYKVGESWIVIKKIKKPVDKLKNL